MNNNTLEIVLRLRDEATKTIQAVSGKFDAAAQSLQKTGTAMMAIGAAPTAALLLASKTAIDFESAFAGVRKTVDASEEEFNMLSDNIRGIAKEAPVSAVELSKIGELAGQLGVRGVDNLTKFIDTISKIGVTTNLTGEEAATSFARIANIMSEPIENVDKMASVVVDLGNNFATTEAEIVNFANRIAGAGKIAGLMTQNVFAIGAAMASVGVEAEAGGTAVQKVLLSLNEAVITGNDDLAIFAKTAEMSAQQFKEVWQEDAMAGFTLFVEGLGKQGDEAIQTLADLGLEDQRLIRAFLSLANAGELLNDTYNKSAKAWMENIALTAEAEKRYATTESQLQILKNNLIDVGITLGSVLLPAINSLVSALRPAIEAFARFAQEHPRLLVGFLALGAAVGALGLALFTIGGLISSVMTIMIGMPAIIAAIGAVIGVVFAPVTLIIMGVVAAVAALYWAWTNNFMGMRDIVMNFVQSVITFFTNLYNTVAPIVTGIYTTVSTVFNSINMVVSAVLSVMFNLVSSTLNNIRVLFDFVFQAIRFVVELVMTLIASYIEQKFGWILNYIVPALNTIAEHFDVNFSASKESVVTHLTEAASWLQTKMSEMLSAVVSITGQIVAKFQSMASGITSALRSIKFPHLSIGEGSVSVGGHSISYPKLNVDWYEKGGWVKDTGLAVVHKGEYVLSRDMLNGRQGVDNRVSNSNNRSINLTAVINNPLDVDDLLFKLDNRLNYAY